MSEADPEGCAACSARLYPPNAYRNGPLYPSYTAAAMKGLFELADRDHVNLLAMLTWAFEFEGKPYFDGYRTLATNGVDKPVLNFFRMAGLMSGDRVAAISSGAAPLDSILKHSVRQDPDIDALATSATGEAAVLLWNYHDEDVAAPGRSHRGVDQSRFPPLIACCCSSTASTTITVTPTPCGRRWDRRKTQPRTIRKAAGRGTTAAPRFSAVDHPRGWRDETECAIAAAGVIAPAADLVL